MTTNEREIAIREGHKIHAETSYFTPRPQLDFVNARYVFCEGFDRGYIAATTEANKRIADLESEVELQRSLNKKIYLSFLELQASNNNLREALEKYGSHEGWCKSLLSTSACDCGFNKALASTPAESLQAHDDELESNLKIAVSALKDIAETNASKHGTSQMMIKRCMFIANDALKQIEVK